VTNGDRSLAVFIDFENLALGFQGRRDRFDISRVLERLVEKGKIVVKKAYADWSRFAFYTAPLHEAAIELIEIPRRGQTGKNSADIRLCVDAMDLAYSKEHIDTFAVVSGDSDFSPLVSKLKELGKHVIGLGMQESTSELLRDNCDEFIYYEDLGKSPVLSHGLDDQIPEAKRKAFALLMESLLALRRENKDVIYSSMIKDTMKRKKPSFNESYHGYRSFSELLEDAAREGLLQLETDKRSRTYVVTRFGAEMSAAPGRAGAEAAAAGDAASSSGVLGLGGRKRSRRRRRGRGSEAAAAANGGAPAAHPEPGAARPEPEPAAEAADHGDGPEDHFEPAPGEPPARRTPERAPQPAAGEASTGFGAGIFDVPAAEPPADRAAPGAPSEEAPAPKSRGRRRRSSGKSAAPAGEAGTAGKGRGSRSKGRQAASAPEATGERA
jgi:uncharacterized protein (TIGR00288 family)